MVSEIFLHPDIQHTVLTLNFLVYKEVYVVDRGSQSSLCTQITEGGCLTQFKHRMVQASEHRVSSLSSGLGHSDMVKCTKEVGSVGK